MRKAIQMIVLVLEMMIQKFKRKKKSIWDL